MDPEAMKDQEPAVAPEVEAVSESVPAAKRRAVWAAALLSLLAWVLLGFVPVGAIASAAVSLLLAVYGVVGTRGSLRSWAVTVIVASGVLLVVFVVFWAVLSSLL